MFQFCVEYTPPVLSVSENTPAPEVIVKGTIALPWDHAVDFKLGHLLANHRLIMTLAGAEHLSLITPDSTVTDWKLRTCYTDQEFKQRRLHFKFNRDIAIEGDGLNFANMGQIAFCKSVHTTKEGVTKDSVSVAWFSYRNTKICNSCYGRMSHAANTECPLRDHCKLCWGYFPDESATHHLLFTCPIVKQLETRANETGTSIFPIPVASPVGVQVCTPKCQFCFFDLHLSVTI